MTLSDLAPAGGLVPELTELRQRAAAGEIGCTLYADGEKRPPPPNPVSEATHGAVCWLVVLVGVLIAAAGASLLLPYGRIAYGVMGVGTALVGLPPEPWRSRST